MTTATIVYDGTCGACSAGARRLRRMLARRGYALVPAQAPGVAELTKSPPEELMREMKLLTQDGRLLGGVDAILHVARSIWWARPVTALARIPGGVRLLEFGYRAFAANRHRISSACAITVEPGSRRWPAYVPLIVLPTIAMFLRGTLSPWAFMWTMALAIYLGCKWLPWWPQRRETPSIARSLGYVLLWPGMDPRRFFSARRAVKPQLRETIWALAKIVLGLAILFIVARWFRQPLAAGWLGMIGTCLALHFGVMHAISIAWRRAGVDAPPIMNAPLASPSLGQFWGGRWNRGFRDLAYKAIFRPLHQRVGAALATLATFVLSGLVHELVITVPARAGFGGPTIYFTLQGFGILLAHAVRVGQAASRAMAILFVLAPLPLLFPASFIERVFIPFMKAIGAS